jgi:hypothetical protein
MPEAIVEILRQWHDFYALIGTASATLVGLVFVTASIGAGFFTAEHRLGMRAFITPTIVHFCAVLFSSAVVSVPTLTWISLGLLLGLGGVVGLAYSCRVWRQIARRSDLEIDRVDRLWYALIPVVGYAMIVATAVLLLLHRREGATAMAAAQIVLLLAGIRNAWDMTVWIVLRSNR